MIVLRYRQICAEMDVQKRLTVVSLSFHALFMRGGKKEQEKVGKWGRGEKTFLSNSEFGVELFAALSISLVN